MFADINTFENTVCGIKCCGFVSGTLLSDPIYFLSELLKKIHT
jgi:hypothetical protein